MNPYDYPTRLKAIWTKAVAQHQAGNRQPETYFDAKTLAELASIGLNTMDVYDYAEDFVAYAEPDFETFLMVSEVRRDYFLNIQKGIASTEVLDPATLPPRTEAVDGIVWLPRLMPKAQAKLRGELSAETMYGCGGDRRFFKVNQIHSAEFLRVVWAYSQDESKIIDWIKSRRT
jgi:hypothetical protein